MEVVPAWPPGTTASMATARSPSEAAYTAAASPAGPAPTIVRSYSARAGGEEADRQAVAADVGRVEHGLHAAGVLDINPFVRDAVPAEEVPNLVADRGRP